MNQTTNKIAIEALIDAAKDALQYHGKHLLTDPPQDAWKHHRVSERLHDALAALAPEVQHTANKEGDLMEYEGGGYVELAAIRALISQEGA